MSTLHSFKKRIARNSLKFMPEMYGNTVGSLVICAMVISGNTNYSEVNKIWNKVVKCPEKYIKCWIDDPEFITKWLKVFSLDVPAEFPIAAAMSRWNLLFVPYIDGHVLPLREDGVMPVTITRAEIVPIKVGESL